jgi:CHASE2 domain-containing sensor protein
MTKTLRPIRCAIIVVLAISAVTCWCTSLAYAQSKPPFELVLINHATEKQRDAFSIDRKQLAQGITILKNAGVAGVVLQLYCDQPDKNAGADQVLAEAIGSIKTVLQARMDDAEFGENPLPDKFVTTNVKGNYKTDLTGNSGWIPLPSFAKTAHDIGFIDIETPDKIPMVMKYKDQNVNSLTLAAIELALGDTAEIDSGNRVTVGGKSISLTSDNQVAVRLNGDKIDHISFTDLVKGKADAARFRDKVVVISQDGARAEIRSSLGTIKPYRLFYLGLLDVWRQLKYPITSRCEQALPATRTSQLPYEYRRDERHH